MGVFNNFGEYNAEEEAARRAENLRCFEESEVQEQQKPTVKIEKSSNGCGSSYYATCPNCGKIKVLSSELNSLSAVCNKCYCAFNLEK